MKKFSTACNSGGSSNLYLTDTEIKRLKEEEEKRVRLERLKQVRNQAKLHAHAKREEYKKVREKEVREHVGVVKKVWEERKEVQLKDLKDKLNDIESNIGIANRNAVLHLEQLKYQALVDQEKSKVARERAEQRFQKGMKVIQEKREVERKKLDEIDNRREKAKSIDYPTESGTLVNQTPSYDEIYLMKNRPLNSNNSLILKREEILENYSKSYFHMKVPESKEEKEEKPSSIRVNKYVIKHFDYNPTSNTKDVEKVEREREEKEKLRKQREKQAKLLGNQAAQKLRNEKFKETIESQLEQVEKLDRKTKVEALLRNSTNTNSHQTLADMHMKTKREQELEKKFEQAFIQRVPTSIPGSSYF